MVLSKVRFTLMDIDQLFEIVRPSGILHSDRLLDVIQEKLVSKNTRIRAMLRM